MAWVNAMWQVGGEVQDKQNLGLCTTMASAVGRNARHGASSFDPYLLLCWQAAQRVMALGCKKSRPQQISSRRCRGRTSIPHNGCRPPQQL